MLMKVAEVRQPHFLVGNDSFHQVVCCRHDFVVKYNSAYTRGEASEEDTDSEEDDSDSEESEEDTDEEDVRDFVDSSDCYDADCCSESVEEDEEANSDLDEAVNGESRQYKRARTGTQ